MKIYNFSYKEDSEIKILTDLLSFMQNVKTDRESSGSTH